jgi:hypothetical protein
MVHVSRRITLPAPPARLRLMCGYFARLEPDTGPMHDPWVHIGRLWTNGDPFLAVDATLRSAWRGISNDDYDQVVGLSPEEDTSVPVGTGRGLLVGADGVVRDDSWMEVFAAKPGLVAVVQASGPDYPGILARALAYPAEDDQDGDALTVDSGQLAIFSAAADGTGRYSGPWTSARPGPVPDVHGPPSPEPDPGLLIPAPHTRYRFKIRWHTWPDEDNCFARWLLTPAPPDDRQHRRATTPARHLTYYKEISGMSHIKRSRTVAHQVELGTFRRPAAPPTSARPVKSASRACIPARSRSSQPLRSIKASGPVRRCAGPALVGRGTTLLASELHLPPSVVSLVSDFRFRRSAQRSARVTL